MNNLKLISETCILQQIRSAARRVTQVYEQALKPVDLTASQFTTMVAIARQEGVTLTVLAERVEMDRTTMPRVLAPLQRRKLVESRTSDTDSRSKALYLSTEGKTVLDEAQLLWKVAQRSAIKQLGTSDRNTVLDALKRVGRT